MLHILAITGPLYLIIALGYTVTRAGLFARADMRVFGKFVMHLALPAMLFNALSQRPVREVLNLHYMGAYALASALVTAIDHVGIAVPDLEQPVLKNTNAVLAMSEADAVLPEPTACIRCGRCIRHCPLRLMPSHIVAAYEAGDMERLAELKVNLCMECGCCSFGCPAHRPLVQTNKLAKAKLAAWRKLQSEKIDAKKEAVQK